MMMKVVLPTLEAPEKQALEGLCCELQRSATWGRRGRVSLHRRVDKDTRPLLPHVEER
jgi:hypothetical protein